MSAQLDVFVELQEDCLQVFGYLLIKQVSWDFPGGPVVKNLPSNTGDTSSIPGWGIKIPHISGQLSPHATTKEPMHPKENPEQPK